MFRAIATVAVVGCLIATALPATAGNLYFRPQAGMIFVEGGEGIDGPKDLFFGGAVGGALTPQVHLEGELNYAIGSTVGTTFGQDIDSPNVLLISGGAVFPFAMESSMTPFAVARIGVASAGDVTVEAFGTSQTFEGSTDMMFGFGGGADFPLGSNALRLEYNFLIVNGDGDSSNNHRIGAGLLIWPN